MPGTGTPAPGSGPAADPVAMAGPGIRQAAAVGRLIEKSPGFASLVLWIAFVDAPASDPLCAEAHAWTDGQRIYLAPSFVDLPANQQVGLAAHEILHLALRHVQRAQDRRARDAAFDWRLANVAMDALVNEHLSGHAAWLAMPGNPPVLSTLLDRCREVARARGVDPGALPPAAFWSWEEVYDLLRRFRDPDGTDATDGKDRRGAGTGTDLVDPGPSTAEARADAAIEAREWQQRLVLAKAGDRPGGILRRLDGDLPRTGTHWTRLLRAKLMRALAVEAETDPARPSRRWLANSVAMADRPIAWEPGWRYRKDRPAIGVVVDTSGSVAPDLLARFFAEIRSIQRLTGSSLRVIACDCAVHGAFDVKPGRPFDPTCLGIGGGGGTDFAPGIAAAEAMRPDVIVYLTDLMGPAGPKPRTPVVWAVREMPGQPTPPPPFGTVVRLR
jgi:predicted metal-dependent peptidase